MRTIKAIAAIAALTFIAACSSEQAAGPASTTVTPGSIADFKQNVGDRVYFDFDQSVVREDGRQTLNKQAEWLKKYTNYPITIEGKCDERGTREYNLALGERRANAVKQYLVVQGPAFSFVGRGGLPENGRVRSETVACMKTLYPKLLLMMLALPTVAAAQ